MTTAMSTRGIEAGPSFIPQGLDERWLTEAVYRDRLSVEEIAARAGVSVRTVREQMAIHGVGELSPNGSKRRPDPARAKELDGEIRKTATLIRRAWVHLSARLHEMHDGEHYRTLGHGSFTAYLDSIELDRSHAYRLLRIHRALIVEHNVDPKRLEGVSSEKVDIAIRPGVRALEELLEDVTTMTPAQLRAKYGVQLPPAPECPTCHRAFPRRYAPRRLPQQRHFPELSNAGWLRERYLGRGMTQAEIAAELGCAQTSVGLALRRHDIPTRNGSEPRAAEHRQPEAA